MTVQGLFTSFARESRPLSVYLSGRPQVRALLQAVRRARSDEDLAPFRSPLLHERLVAIRSAVPELGPQGLGDIREGDGVARDIGGGVRLPTVRYYARYKIDGDLELLEYWPDEADAVLRPVDDELIDRIGGYDKLAHASEEDVAAYWQLTSTWTLGTVHDSGPWALYTYLDLTRDEEKQRATDGTMAHILDARYARIAPIVAAIATQTERFFDQVLPGRVETLVTERAEVLADRSAIARSLNLPPEWAPAPVLLEQEVAEPPQPTDTAGDSPTSAQPVTGSAGVEMDGSLEITSAKYKLAAKSFGDVLQTIRTWADAVEGNPRGFSRLDEDAISDLLAATLNATTPYAGREVYSRSGKTDIYIAADVLAAGAGPAKVFILESKWADARDRVVSALEEQLFRYATAHTTSAVLLALCRQKDFNAARQHILEWAGEAAGCTGPAAASEVATWPVLSYRVDGTVIDVCVATVSIPQVSTRKGRAK